MSGAGSVDSEWGRARPAAGGLWALFSWLRRDDRSSTDSVSSVGSDRTALSFAFVPGGPHRGPAPCAPPSPSSDTYRRRVHERSLRRQRERDLTLHRKYGLYGLGFDAGSLPPASARRLEQPPRARRAVSETPRAHVPGKRRAPPPPSATLPRRRAKKRPAPPPPRPVSLAEAPGDFPMSLPPLEGRPRAADVVAGCKPEKYGKRDPQNKDVKLRPDKSFLKHIFENKKRNSAIDTSSVRLLPNISELDKQAAEIIEKYRLREMSSSEQREKANAEGSSSVDRRAETWICTICLRKYDATVITCTYCLSLNKLKHLSNSSKVSDSTQTKSAPTGAAHSSAHGNLEEKEKLKEMLKEMKDSLPKRPKSEVITNNKNSPSAVTKDYTKITEAATLRIGSTACENKSSGTASTSDAAPQSQLTSQNKKHTNGLLESSSNVKITKPVVFIHTKENVVKNSSDINIDRNPVASKPLQKQLNILEYATNDRGSLQDDPKSHIKSDLHTPLKISSLLNPIYIPKTSSSVNTQTQSVKPVEIKPGKKDNLSSEESKINTEEIIRNLITPQRQTKPTAKQSSCKIENQLSKVKMDIKSIKQDATTTSVQSNVTKNKKIEQLNINRNNVTTDANVSNFKNGNKLISEAGPSTSQDNGYGQHARRRDLINQLEQSIAKGDERAAADAAVKLAKLKLSCSVLSFSSQIVRESTESSSNIPIVDQDNYRSNKTDNNKEIKIDKETKQNISQDCKQNSEPNATSTKDFKQVINDIHKKHLKPVETHQNIFKKSKQASTSKENTKNDKEDPSVKDTRDTPANLLLNQPSTSKAKTVTNENEEIPIAVWVEDKEATRGPVQLTVRRGARLGSLRRRAERSLGLAAALQRWIVGRALASDDAVPLAALAGPDLAAPFYLCLVQSGTAQNESPKTAEPEAETKSESVYKELVRLEQQALVPNTEAFECGVCLEPCAPGEGAVVRECVHAFCRACLAEVARGSAGRAPCPAPACGAALQEREVRALLPAADFERWLALALRAAESSERSAFHCRTPDCAGWALCEPAVRRFHCPVCRRYNCLSCQAIHEEESCEQYRARLTDANAKSEAGATDEGTRALLESLIARGEALECPECHAIITKKWGCDWIKCSACKTEICWVTRGRRWGPAGRGDTSAGCRCGVDGKRCHPSCGYCH